MVYKEALIGEKFLCNGQWIEIVDNDDFDRLIQFTENKLAGQKKGVLKRQNNNDYKLPYEEIVKKYVRSDDVLRNIPSAYPVFDKHQRQEGNKPDNIKINDVKKMDFSENPLIGYEIVEQKIIQQRLDELAQEFNLEKSTDKFLARRVALCELKIMQLETLASMNHREAAECQKQIDLLDKQYRVYCDSLNVLKKQRDNTKDKPKDDSEDIINMIKSVDEMKREAEDRKNLISQKIKEKVKRK
jgi:hypothetical protein